VPLSRDEWHLSCVHLKEATKEIANAGGQDLHTPPTCLLKNLLIFPVVPLMLPRMEKRLDNNHV